MNATFHLLSSAAWCLLLTACPSSLTILIFDSRDPTDTGSYSTFPTAIIIFPRCILAYESRVMLIKLTVEYRFNLFCGCS